MAGVAVAVHETHRALTDALLLALISCADGSVSVGDVLPADVYNLALSPGL